MMNWKKIIVFIISLVVIMLLFNLLFRFILPIKPVRLQSQAMEPGYSKGEVVFYKQSQNFSVNEVILFETSRAPTISRIIAINEDGTFQTKMDNNKAQLEFEKSVSKKIIKGKVISSVSPFLFYLLSWGVQIILAFLLTQLLYSKISKK